METKTSGQELVTKARKPYTITKQRERWTADEHNKFLKALRLYGRAWQRIEEHIGTKTAVQIRSHAQKFFTKLEKEAEAKGVAVCEALDIEIPPPRPKRKPTSPYPRKVKKPTSQVSSAEDAHLDLSASSSICRLSLDLEKDPPLEPQGGKKVSSDKEDHDDNCSGVSTHLSSVNQCTLPENLASKNPNPFKESETSLRKETADNGGTSKISNTDDSRYSRDKSTEVLPQMNMIGREGNGVNGLSSADDMHSMQHYPYHIPLHVLNKSMNTSLQSFPGIGSQDSMFRPTIPATSSTTSQHQAHLQISSMFSNLVVSNLLQNPTSLAAASFAASVWPYGDVGSCNDSSTSTIQTGGQMLSSPPSMAAIAAATVAAATAWWASHGLVPLCASFTCSPLVATDVSPPPSVQAPLPETVQHPVAEKGKALEGQTPPSMSDGSEGIERSKQNMRQQTEKHEDEAGVVVEAQDQVQDSSTAQKKKLVEGSSCGSNTPSGSDVETDALEKVEKGKEDANEADGTQVDNESSNRRARGKDNSSDSWKEVSEEGRMAFDALFARGRLPQNFEIKTNKEEFSEKEKRNLDEKERETIDQMNAEREEKKGDDGEGVGSIEIRRMGFKPYKRCSMEAEESQADENNVSKKIRLEGKGSV